MSLLLAGCSGPDERTLFEKFGNGLDALSHDGATDIQDMSITDGNDTVTILETFYNESSIYIGFKLEGEALIKNEPGFQFFWDGKAVGSGAHGGFLNDEDVYSTWTMYGVMQPSSWYDISQLPEEFTLDFIVMETTGPKRKFEFKIPMKRSDREVVKPYPRSLG